MKKIVALALCLIMALSLATVAFGATTYKDGENYYCKDFGGTFTYHKAVAAKEGATGALAYFYDGTTVLVPCESTEDGAKAMKAGAAEGDAVLGYVKSVESVGYNYVGKAVAKSTLSCTTDGIAKGYYADVDYDDKIDDNEYFVASDTGAVTLLVDGKLVKVAPQTIVKGSHVLYLYKTEKVSDGVYAYKCAKCGQVFNCTTDKAYAGDNYAEYDVAEAAAASAVYYADGYKAMVDATKPWAETDMFIIGAGTAASGVTSAKTFDAGVALYAGMALMSVAGSAVVIGKKKEF